MKTKAKYDECKELANSALDKDEYRVLEDEKGFEIELGGEFYNETVQAICAQASLHFIGNSSHDQ